MNRQLKRAPWMELAKAARQVCREILGVILRNSKYHGMKTAMCVCDVCSLS